MQTGVRWATGHRQEQYQRIIAFDGEGDADPPEPHARPLGDYLHPYRPGRPTTVLNAVSRAVSDDCAGWAWERLVTMAGQLKRERETHAE